MCAPRSQFLELLQWARAQDPPAPWSERTCTVAATRGDLELVQWARSQSPPAPWDQAAVVQVAEDRHHLDLLHWARAQSA